MDSQSVSNLLQLAATRIVRRVRNSDALNGLSATRMSVLSQLLKDGSQTLSELARIERVRPPTMTNVVRGLEEDGFIVRRIDKLDRRIARIQITAKGKRRLQRGLKSRESMLDGLLEGLSAKDKKAVEKAARILDARLAGAGEEIPRQ